MILLAVCYVCFIIIIFILTSLIAILHIGSMACRKFFNDSSCNRGGFARNDSVRNAYHGGRTQNISKSKSQPGEFFTNEKNLEILTKDIFSESSPKSIPMLYEDLPNNGVVYSSCSVCKHAKTTKHVGQLKLQLNEIEFLTDELPSNDAAAIFVYAGSAPSNHLPKVAELFPNVKFLLVDPHEHVLHFVTFDAKLLKRRITHLDDEFHALPEFAQQVVYFKHGKTRFPGSLIDLMTPAGIKRVPKSEELATREIEDYDEVVRVLAETNHRYYILEDLFTDNLASALGAIVEKTPVYFCSDIRTSSNPNSVEMFSGLSAEKPTKYDPSPGDIDVLWNLAQQLIWLKLMRPKSAMLKFRVPYYNKLESIDNLPPYQMETFDKARLQYGVDFLANYVAKKFVYLKRQKIYLQAFAEVYSGETRYVVNNYDEFEELDMKEYENKLYYYNNFERALRYHHGQEWCFSKEIGVDACGDCALMIEIYKKYYSKYFAEFSEGSNLRKNILAQIDSSMFTIDRKLKDKRGGITNHGNFYKPFRSVNDLMRD